LKKLFLIVSGVGLSTIGLSYGAAPDTLLPNLFGFPVENVNLIHIFRTLMFIYFSMSAFWIYAAFKRELIDAAVISVVFFMTVLALGRIFSIVVDGAPHWLLVLYTGAELGIAAIGLWALKKANIDQPNA